MGYCTLEGNHTSGHYATAFCGEADGKNKLFGYKGCKRQPDESKKKKKEDLLLLSSLLAPAPLIRFWLHFNSQSFPKKKLAARTGAGGSAIGQKAAVWYKFGEGR